MNLKPIIILISVVVVIICVVYWHDYLRPAPVTDGRMINFCHAKHQLDVSIMESAEYFSDFDTRLTNDTLHLSISITSVLNPFGSKTSHKLIDLKPEVKYISIANNTIGVDNIHKCEGPYLQNIKGIDED